MVDLLKTIIISLEYSIW